jgi:hypothetical protein
LQQFNGSRHLINGPQARCQSAVTVSSFERN